MVLYTREELLAAAGARPDDLTALEQQRLVVPHRPWRLWRVWRLFGRCPVWYTDTHLNVLRRFVCERHAVEENHRLMHEG
jgi:hypothetical protein